MRNGKEIAGRRVLAKHGIAVSDEVIREVLAATAQAEGPIYEKGDFVEIYDGMGECSFGTVMSKSGGDYRVMTFNYHQADSEPYTRIVRQISRLSSEEEAMDYFKIRSAA